MRRLGIFIFLTLALTGCAVSTPVQPRTGFKITGATIASPNQPGWITSERSPSAILLYGPGERQGETRFVYALAISLDASMSDPAFLAEAKRAKTVNDDPDRLLPMKTQTRNIRFKGAYCLRFDLMQQDTKSKAIASGPQFINTIGYTCRHPDRRDLAVELTYSKRSSARNLTGTEKALAQQFFSDARFSADGF